MAITTVVPCEHGVADVGSLRGPLGERPEDSGEPRFVELVRRDLDHGLVEAVLGVVEFEPVVRKKGERRRERGALVAVEKGLRLRDVERVGRRLGPEVRGRYSPPKVACGVATADSSPSRERIPWVPPKASISRCWMAMTCATVRKRGVTSPASRGCGRGAS
jgi:hypothetical protein